MVQYHCLCLSFSLPTYLFTYLPSAFERITNLEVKRPVETASTNMGHAHLFYQERDTEEEFPGTISHPRNTAGTARRRQGPAEAEAEERDTTGCEEAATAETAG